MRVPVVGPRQRFSRCHARLPAPEPARPPAHWDCLAWVPGQLRARYREAERAIAPRLAKQSHCASSFCRARHNAQGIAALRRRHVLLLGPLRIVTVQAGRRESARIEKINPRVFLLLLIVPYCSWNQRWLMSGQNSLNTKVAASMPMSRPHSVDTLVNERSRLG